MSMIDDLRALLTKATPGPWKLQKGMDGAAIKAPASAHVSVAWFGAATASGLDGSYRISGAEANANADLAAAPIAALPALLDVAEAAQDVLAWGGTQHESAKLDALEAALRRLEGEDGNATT